MALLDSLDIPYVLGGSLASSLFGEPRSTADVDVAIRADRAMAPRLLELLSAQFYIPTEAAAAAFERFSSFNLIDKSAAMKVDLFVLGPGVLDRMQLERRIALNLPGVPAPVWVTSPEDQVLRKLDWYRATGETSDRQWRDVAGILNAQRGRLDMEYLLAVADECGLSALLERVLSEQ